MDADKYAELAMITLPEHQRGRGGASEGLINAVLGIAGEGGELADAVKKWCFHGHTLDSEHLIEEAGDVLWYIALLADYLGVSLSDIMQRNIDKLQARYPQGFTSERSINRDRLVAAKVSEPVRKVTYARVPDPVRA